LAKQPGIRPPLRGWPVLVVEHLGRGAARLRFSRGGGIDGDVASTRGAPRLASEASLAHASPGGIGVRRRPLRLPLRCALTERRDDGGVNAHVSAIVGPGRAVPSAPVIAAERSGFERDALLRSWGQVNGEMRDMWPVVRTRSGIPQRWEASLAGFSQPLARGPAIISGANFGHAATSAWCWWFVGSGG
jgi:hypothetical protein